MATMYPNTISPSTKSKAEKILFEKFEANLNDEYSVIHSRQWISPISEKDVGSEGECDFIVLHPQNGILFIEAKSGFTFSCHSDGNQWYCQEYGELKNPIIQANTSKWNLIKFLRGKGLKIKLPYNHAAAFPQASRFKFELPPEILPDMLIFEPDLDELQSKIPKAMSIIRQPSPEPIPDVEFQRILHALIPIFGITTTASSGLTTMKKEFFELEREQIHALDLFEQNKDVLVKGCAGSGKTLIAIEKARRLAENKNSVLFLTYNIGISKQITERIQELNIDVDVFHFHGLCQKVIEDTGGVFEINNSDIDQFWDITVPEMVSERIERYGKRYDALIIDEYQDFFGNWVDVARQFLSNKDDGVFYAFSDDDQNIFLRTNSDHQFGAHISLKKNMRNSPSIVEWINKTCSTDMIPSKELSGGQKPVIRKTISDKDELNQIWKVIRLLNEKAKVETKQIVILGKHSFNSSIFAGIKKLGKYIITENPIWSGNENEIRYSSIYRFKGLETDVALLTGVNLNPREDIPEDFHRVLYSSASRAKMLLYVFLRQTTK